MRKEQGSLFDGFCFSMERELVYNIDTISYELGEPSLTQGMKLMESLSGMGGFRASNMDQIRQRMSESGVGYLSQSENVYSISGEDRNLDIAPGYIIGRAYTKITKDDLATI